jgi:hypothetical protein
MKSKNLFLRKVLVEQSFVPISKETFNKSTSARDFLMQHVFVEENLVAIRNGSQSGFHFNQSLKTTSQQGQF